MARASRLRRSRIFLLGAAGEQEENGLGASASGPARTLTQNVLLGSRVVSQKVNFLGQGNKGSSRLPLGEERANILLLACCYQEGWPRAAGTVGSLDTEQLWKLVRTHDYVAGDFMWTGI